jgi:hypothetical protein
VKTIAKVGTVIGMFILVVAIRVGLRAFSYEFGLIGLVVLVGVIVGVGYLINKRNQRKAAADLPAQPPFPTPGPQSQAPYPPAQAYPAAPPQPGGYPSAYPPPGPPNWQQQSYPVQPAPGLPYPQQPYAPQPYPQQPYPAQPYYPPQPGA